MQLNLVHKFLPSFFRGAMTSWAQLALIGTTHRLTTNAWVGKTLSGRECWNKSAPNYQKGHLWISTPPPLSPGCSGVFPSDDNPFTKVPFNAEIFFVHWRWNPVKKVSIGCEDTFVRLMVLSLQKCSFGCGETFCPLRWNPVYKVSAGVAVHLLPIPGTRQQQQCIRQQQCTADVKCGPFAAWDLSLDIRQQFFAFVLLKEINI